MNFFAPYAQLASSNMGSLMESLGGTDSHFFDESRFNENELRKALNMHDGLGLSSSGLMPQGGQGSAGGSGGSGGGSRANAAGPGLDRKISAMKQILAAISYGRDCSSLFPDVVKNVATSNLELKKLT